MDSSSENEETKQPSGVVLLFDAALAKRKPKPCFFCGETGHLHSFKGKLICPSCRQIISSLFVCS